MAGGPALDEALRDVGGHTPIERRFLALVRRAGLPKPTCQVQWRANGTVFARVDFDFDPFPLVVEVGGRLGHASDADRARDGHRRNELQLLGITVLDFTSSMVVDQGGDVIETVRRHLVRLGLPERRSR